MTTPLAIHVTDHAIDRLAERLGLEADRQAIRAALMQMPVVRVALRMGGTCTVHVPSIEATLMLRDGCLTTIVTADMGRKGRTRNGRSRSRQGSGCKRRPDVEDLK